MTQDITATSKQTRNLNIQTTDPQQNSSIRASAGTGKTYLLVSRLLRLMLLGAEPSSLLAITFTRKAAAEMQQRLHQRMLSWLKADNEDLACQLELLGIDPHTITHTNMLHQARQLYEQVLRNDQLIRITTFHAFCQDILRRFPLEADVPPGFDLLQDTGLMAERAWNSIWYDATTNPDTAPAQALEYLLQSCGSIDTCRRSLFDFLHHRSDWWSFTRHVAPELAVDWASNHLSQQLDIKATQNPAQEFFSAECLNQLQSYNDLLCLHVNQINLKLSALIKSICFSLDQKQAQHDILLRNIELLFYTQTGGIRKTSASNARAKAMGVQGQLRFLDLHESLKSAFDQAIDAQQRLESLKLSTAWYQAGQHLTRHYQQLKQEQRLLDFTDLEWRACCLLNDGQHSHWIQYKLDQRIDHILIDEFQDTNPTQWQLLLPLLQELAANGGHGNSDRQQSIFIVGDEKQSIYRFRRADPRLFDTATHWLTENTGASSLPLSTSWRSSQAIIDCVNRVFSQSKLAKYLPSFTLHQTHRHDLAGRAELLPLVRTTDDSSSADIIETGEPAFRNPLLTPRIIKTNDQHLYEGRMIASHIRSLLGKQPDLAFRDIMILVRQRTHLHDYEQALRETGIPYTGNGKKTLLDTLEIQDMVALLQTLTSPGNNLALAQTLRSPIFACSNEELALVASYCREKNADNQHIASDWITALYRINNHSVDTLSENSPLARATKHLSNWRTLAQTLPVHDLLDRIYTEANIENRYQAAFPPHLRQRVKTNLLRFAEIALEIDSGRYPSLPAFLDKLNQLQQYSPDNIAQTNAVGETDTSNAVRVLTIHAAKGLEAAAVYLIDSGYKRPQPRAWQTLIDWPSDCASPQNFTLTSRSKTLDSWSRKRLENEAEENLREDCNLLYVALTRARQYLFISGCAHQGDGQGWYQHIAAAFPDSIDANNEQRVLTTVHFPGNQIRVDIPGNNTAQHHSQIFPELSRGMAVPVSRAIISPSDTNNTRYAELESLDEDVTRIRGIIIHRLLEVFSTTATTNLPQAFEQVRFEFLLQTSNDIFDDCVTEVNNLVNSQSLQQYFNPEQGKQTLNEVPISYEDSGQNIHGVIDRLIIDDSSITLIDYKSGCSPSDNIVETFRQQLMLYANGIKIIWPDKVLHTILIFTATATAIKVD